jgi:hypothetical protein
VAAMLAAGAAGGAAAGAQASTIYTTTLDLGPGSATPDYLVFAGTGFNVSNSATSPYKFDYIGGSTTTFDANLAKDAHLGLVTTTPGLPAPSESFPGVTYDATVNGVGPGVTEYVHFEFNGFTGFKGVNPQFTEFLGEATFGADGTLDSISFAAAPEPETWALLLAGLGMAGGAMRMARRRQLAKAA